MEPDPLLPDDPRLTAYALDEMTPAEKAGFEQLLQQQPAARAAVEEIRATTALLTAALENEPLAPAAQPEPKRDPYAKVIRFPYWQISGLAAACFVFFFVYWQRNTIPTQTRTYIEVPLPTLTDAKAEARAKTAAPTVAMNSPVAEPARAKAELKKRDELDSSVTADATRQTANAVTDHQMPAAPAVDAVAAAQPAPAAPKLQEAVVLSPFSVTAKEEGGFAERNVATTVTGTGLDYKDTTYGNSSTGASGQSLIKEQVLRRREMELRSVGAISFGGTIAGKPNTEAYNFRKDSDYLRVADQPLSTFSADVDTAAYTNLRRFLTQGQLPPADAVRIEELVNYFPYHYAAPLVVTGQRPAPAPGQADKAGAPPVAKATPPFAASLEVAAAPWAPGHRLVRIGLKGREISDAARPAANLVFLLDVSGSMDEPNRLPLVKQSLHLLVEKLRPEDRVAIVVYAGASGLALPSTSAARKAEILDAIDRLEAEGSTNGAAGIQLAYDIAKANFIPGGVNRVILATDGDFNVGVTGQGELVRLIAEKAQSGVFLTVLGFGMGNYKDATLEQLADKGNGNYAYIDSLAEAKKTLVEQAGGTLVTIAKDVKLQVEFNPAQVQAYRLIGYEKRLLAKEDFNNDRVDAGEIGAGHTVTALYEIVPVGATMPGDTPAVDALKYQAVSGQASAGSQDKADSRMLIANASAELLTVKIRYKDPAGEVSSKLEFPLRDTGAGFEQASQDFKFAAAVAAFGMALRDSPYKGTTTLANVLTWARTGLGDDAGGYRNEFIALVERAQKLSQ